MKTVFGNTIRAVLSVITILIAWIAPFALNPTRMEAVPYDMDTAHRSLQFTSCGHMLAFNTGGVTIASRDHMLRTEFIGSRGAVPEADATLSTGDGRAGPLSKVTYENVWDGVTVVYEAGEDAIAESTYYIDSPQQAGNIRLCYNRPVSVDGQGNLVISFANGNMVESAPVAWQEISGQKRPVEAAYEIYGEKEVGFSIRDCLPGMPVVIDPLLVWNTFLGTTGDDDCMAIFVDGSGNVYVAGYSNATWGGGTENPLPRRAFSVAVDAFAAKLNSSGTLLWNTFLGGAGNDYGTGIAADGSGNVYVAGHSNAAWGFDPVREFTGTSVDAFAAKLNSTGQYQWHTFLGGSGNDYGTGIAVNGSGNVFVGGYSESASWGGGTYNSGVPTRAYTGFDAFVAKLVSSTGALTWNAFLGSAYVDYGNGIAVDGSGNIYVTGYSNGYESWGMLPARAFTTISDAFVAKVNGVTGTLAWYTFLGGTEYDYGYAVCVDGSGYVYAAGYSNGTWGAPVRAFTGTNSDAFAARLNASTGALLWHTFLGGSGADYGRAICVDGSGNSYVGGYSLGTWGTPARSYTGLVDAFAARLDSSGGLKWNTFLGGSSGDWGWAIDSAGGSVFVAGRSSGTWGSPKRAYTPTAYDGFAARLDATAGDFNGDGKAEIGYFRPSTGVWKICTVGTFTWGQNGDIPVADDYNGDGKWELAYFRPSTGGWRIKNVGPGTWGQNGDVPVPGDYNGDGKYELAYFRPSTGVWKINTVGTFTWGQNGDIPVPGDYNGDGKWEIAYFRPSTGGWRIKNVGPGTWGQNGDIPVPGDYNGDGKYELAYFRPSTGVWKINTVGTFTWGQNGDVPVPGDYNGDGKWEIAYFRPSTGGWRIKDVGPGTWGQNGDVPANILPSVYYKMFWH